MQPARACSLALLLALTVSARGGDAATTTTTGITSATGPTGDPTTGEPAPTTSAGSGDLTLDQALALIQQPCATLRPLMYL